jgi:hypothetical protein
LLLTRQRHTTTRLYFLSTARTPGSKSTSCTV